LSGTGKKDAGGFALILVVWLLVLIGTIGTYLVANGRAETAIAYNVRAAATAEALADAGIARIAFNQTDPEAANRWKLDGASHRISVPTGEIAIRLEDETQKINPNLASDALLAALFEVSGVDRSSARRLGAAVADWVSPDGPAREGGAKLDQYHAAGRSYGPPNAPMESLDELGLVLGMTPAILTSVRPYLTIYTEAAEPNAKNAPLLIQRAIALAARIPAGDGETAPAEKPDAKPQAAEEHLIAAEITARSRDGGVFVRTAVLRLEPESAKAYSVPDWQRGALDDGNRRKISDW
jgi:general secretion pathway protein K